MSSNRFAGAESGAAVELMPSAFRLTDFGNAERFVARNRGRVRYCPQRNRWLLFTGSRWEWDEGGGAMRLAKETVRAIYGEAERCDDDDARKATAKHARESEKASRLQALLALAQSEEGVSVTLAELDADPYALNCSNGTIDLRTGTLRPHDARDLITRTTGVPFDPAARSELWDRVLHDATGGDADLAEYIQRVLGYALIGVPLERAFFFLYGPPGTAKSTLVGAFHDALGSYAVSASFETWLTRANVGGNRGDLVRLAGARLVTSVEVRCGARWDEALVKATTGGDEIVASAKFESEVSFRPSFTLVLAANDAPNAREDDEGLWARMRRVPLIAQIPPERQDPTVKTRLREPEHASAVLAWMVAGCLDYQKNGLGSCSAVQASTAEYRKELDHFSDFLSDCCEFESYSRISRRDLRVAYEEWARETGRKSLLSAREIAVRLRARECREVTVQGLRCWTGLRTRTVGDYREGSADE